jgi:beta-lactamase class A
VVFADEWVMSPLIEGERRLEELGLSGSGYAAPVAGGTGIGFNADELVAPASVVKIQVALAVECGIAAGAIDGAAARILSPESRTSGPVGVSLMRDEVRMSLRDLVVAMLTISDNAATDELIDVVGLAEINAVTRELGLEQTVITATLRDTLDEIAAELGFGSYDALVARDPAKGAPSSEEVVAGLHTSAALDPRRGTRTTAAETVRLLQAIWTDRAGPPDACASIRRAMCQQLTRHRIASAFAPPVTVAAKSGGLLGVARNEAGVVGFPDEAAYAVAVFTRRRPGTTVNPALIDTAIGEIARDLIDQLRAL